MDTITAEQARKLTKANLKGPAIESFVSTLTNKIKAVAADGKSNFDPWSYLSTLRGTSPSIEQREAIKFHFTNSGFRWQEFPDPDPGHPCSRSYTLISW